MNPLYSQKGKICIVLTPRGISTISFMGNELDSLPFLAAIRSEINDFEERVKKIGNRKVKENANN